MKRLTAWALILAAAAAVGFGLGALTFKPPAPEFEGEGVGESAAPTATASSPGAERRVVPDLVGLRRAAAENQLEELHVLYAVDPVNGPDTDEVVRQFPDPGTPAGKALHVLLGVRCRPRPCPQPPLGGELYDPCSCAFR